MCDVNGSARQIVIADQLVGSSAVVGQPYPVDFDLSYFQKQTLYESRLYSAYVKKYMVKIACEDEIKRILLFF